MKLPQSFDFRSLEVFVAVVRAGGMTSAAKSLGLTQSAVSQTIANLEDAIGTSLVDRSVRPLQLTPGGNILFEKAKSLLSMATDTVQSIREPDGHALKTLHIAMADSLAFSIGPHLVNELHYMANHWRITSGLSIDHETAFNAGEIDMMFVAGDLTNVQQDNEHHLITTEQFLVAAPASYQGPTDTLEELYASHKLVRFSLRSFTGRKVEQQINRLQIKVPLWLEIDSPMAQLAMIGTGNAWGFTTPMFLLQAPDQLKNIRLFKPPKGTFPRHIFSVARANQFGDIPERITNASRKIISTKVIPKIRELADWLPEHITVPDG